MITRFLALSFSLATIALADEVLYFSMEDTASPLVDTVNGLEATETDFGQAYQVDGPEGFGSAVSLSQNGSWQLTADDSAVMRDLANDFSVAVWVYLDSALNASKTGVNPQHNRVVGDDEAWDADGWSMGVWNDGRVRFTKNGIVDIDLGNPGAVPFDEWAHIAATVSSTEGCKLFVNGIPVGTSGNTTNCNTGTGNNGVLDVWGIGRSYGLGEDQWFAGRIDELRVFDHVLNEGQVADLMVVPRDPALVTNLLVQQTSPAGINSLTLQVTNEGENNGLDLAEVTFSGPDAGDFSQGTLPGTISPGNSAALEINFSPSRGSGTYTTIAALASNDPQKPILEVTLEVTVIDPVIRIEGDLDFGEPASTPVTREVSLFNDGQTENLQISAIRMAGFRGEFFTVTPTSATVAPGESTDLTVTFDPAGEGGLFPATLEIDSNDTSAPTATLEASASLPFGPTASRLVSHFTFDQSTNLGRDDGSFGLDGTPQGGASFTSDARIGGGALLLDGLDGVVVLDGAAEYSSLDDNGVGFTVAAWVNLDPAAFGTARIISTFMEGGFSAEGWGLGFGGAEGGNLLATTYGRLDYLSPQPSTPTPGEWHHLAYIYRNAPINEIEFFVDGVSVGSTTTTGPTGMIDSVTGFAIGSIGIPDNPQLFFGKLDDLRIYDIELSDEEIVTLANAQELAGGLRIVSTRFLGDSFEMTWNSLPGRNYRVERSYDNPFTGQRALENWEEVADSLEATGESTTYTDSNLPEDIDRVFYRVSDAP
jgi:hypothetical protein